MQTEGFAQKSGSGTVSRGVRGQTVQAYCKTSGQREQSEVF